MLINKRTLLVLTILVAVLYQYATAEPEDEEDGGNWLQSLILSFLQTLAIQIGETLALKGLWRLTQSAINALKKKGVKTLAEKAGEKALVKEGEKIAEKEGEKIAEKEAEKIAEKEGEKIIEKDAIKAIDKEATQLVETQAEALARKQAEAEAEVLAQKEIEKEAETLATKEAEKLAEKDVVKAGEKVGEKVAEKIVTEEAIKVAEKEGEKIAIKTGEKMAEHLGVAMARLASEAWNPFEWVLFGITTALYAGLGLDASMFKPCPTGYWTFSELPSWAIDLINAFPVVGDIFGIIGELICFREGCGEKEEYNAGLCYPKCADDEKSDGATMCYKQYSDATKYGDNWETREFPAQPTITSVTKRVLTNTGMPLHTCPEGQEKQGLLCYEPCKPGYDAVLDRCWARIQHMTNVGRIPDKVGCDVYKNREGWDNSRDDGTSCWEDLRTWTTGDWKKAVWESGHQEFHSAGCGCIKKALWERNECRSDEDRIDGLCYPKCPAGMSHPPGLPYDCRTDGDISYYRGSGQPMGCGPGENQDSLGLCYKDPPPGFKKSTLGMMETPCPEGTVGDFGVGCIRASHNRGLGKVALDIKMKERDNYYGHKDAGGGYFPDIPEMVRNAPGFK